MCEPWEGPKTLKTMTPLTYIHILRVFDVSESVCAHELNCKYVIVYERLNP